MEIIENTINVTRADRGEHWLVGGDVVTVKASELHTGGEMLVIEVAVPAGGGPPGCTGTPTRRLF